MKLNIYAVMDIQATALVRFAFGNNDSSFVRDNLPNDIYNRETRRGLPIDDLSYEQIGTVDTETLQVVSCPRRVVDIKTAYKFKFENETESVSKKE